MCGITGLIDFKKRSSKQVLLDMTTTLTHRGPDGHGVLFQELNEAQIGLGHRRLSIIDLSENGAQPMSYLNLDLTFNGEIYNYQEIKDDLKKLGHSFVGDSDTEMILHAYRQWGIDCVHKFIGMFAIVLIDKDLQKAFFVRDRAGVKPLFLYQKDGLFMFASELKAFHKNPFFEKEINPNAVASFLQYGNVPSDDCIFHHCSKLLPGHTLTLDLKSRQQEIKQYWNVYDAYNSGKLDISYDDAMRDTESLLKSAFNYRMVADVPVGVFLSGGFDSTCVTSILQSERTEKLKTFTIGVPDIGLNEAPYAKDIADHLGTDHTEITCTQKEAIDLIKDLPFFFDEPFADSSAIPTTLVSKVARESVTVALSADAGDEIFAGYNRYDYMARYGKKLNRIPSFLRKPTAALMRGIPSDKIPVLRNKYNFHNRYEKLKLVLRDPSDEQIMLSLSQQFTKNQLDDLMQTSFVQSKSSYLSKELNQDTYSTLAYMQAIDYQTYLVDDILQKVDRSTMAVSLEGREPFLDHRIIEFAARLPDSYKYHDGIKKRILRDITYKYVPKELLDRPKMGFAIPIAEWLTNDLRDYVDHYLSQNRIEREGLLNWNAVKKLKETFFGGKKEYDFKIWYLLMFEMWYDKWMNN